VTPPHAAPAVSAAGVAERVRATYPDVVVARDEASVSLGREDLLSALESFRADPALRLDFLSSVTATDWPGRDPRFWVVYEISSSDLHHRLRVKVGLHEDDLHVPSVTGLFPTADWHERETFDFYGVVFDGHPDLRRILLPDDWEGWPLRKTEELGGVDTRYHGAFIPPVDRRTS
jgi:NADH-quinone oxidoreductase subunit C